MKGDFSRNSFAPRKHFAAVLKQQGRVDLDADWNEQSAIERHVEETTTGDVVGPSGAPQEGGGFEIAYVETDGNPDLSVSEGRIYVDGVLCEAEAGLTYAAQPDHPAPDTLAPSAGRSDLVYLDVWRRHITYIEDPYIREVALGGPDTATRLQTVAQVKVQTDVGDVTCADDIAGWPPGPSQGLLTASTIEAGPPPDPCTLAAVGGYQGLENRFYRVEIHDGGEIGTATFKWSRDNASVVYIVDEFIDGQPTQQLRLANLGRDDVLQIHVGDWVEVLDDAVDLSVEGPGTLAQVTELDETERIVTLNIAISGLSPDRHPKLRRWDQSSDAITVTTDTFELEYGITVNFTGSGFRSGDYWTFAARSITGEIEVRSECPPDGPEHWYCALAIVTWQETDGAWTPAIQDCRNLFPPLTALTRFYYVGGDGQEAMPSQPLPELLRVAVMNGLQPVEGALVSFTADRTGARVAASIAGLPGATDSSIILATGADGIASCAWQLENDVGDPSQVLTATLLNASEAATTHPPVRFNANLSIASQVWYDSAGCINPENPDNVQDALADLCANYSLYYVGGDGQEAPPKEKVPYPLHVRVANGRWPVQDARVTFRVTDGGGVVDGGAGAANEATVGSDADGYATVGWILGAEGSQQVIAFLDGNEDVAVWFNATVRLAVQGGPGIRVVEVVTASGGQLQNDTDVPTEVLAGGIRLICDRPPDPDSLVNKRVCFLTVELPYPLTGADRSFWGVEVPFATQPITIGASIQVTEGFIVWLPNEQAREWLLNRLFPMLQEIGFEDRVLARLIVQGNFVWSPEDRETYLDGDTFGIPGDGRTGIRFPTGDDRPGGDLRMWFWLVPGKTGPAVVAVDDVVSTFLTSPLTINVLANDTGEGLTIDSVTSPRSGANVTNTGTVLVYTPIAGFTGVDTFTYTVRDRSGETATAQVTVNVIRISVGGDTPRERTPVFELATDELTTNVTEGVRGTGFAGNEEITLIAESADGSAIEIGRATADSDGTFSTNVVLSESAPEGEVTLRAIGNRGDATELGRNITLRRR